VEHPCYQCNAPVEEGVAFCPQCNAPLIRVAVPDETSELPLPLPLRPVLSAAGIQWPRALGPAAMAGFIASILMLFPLGAFGLGMILAGILSVVFYRWRNPGSTLTSGMGARLGAMSGLLGFVMFLFFAAISASLAGGSELRRILLQAVEQSAARANDPQSQRVLEFLRTPQGLAAVMIAGIAFAFVAFLVLTSLGGAIGAALLGRRPRS
jgi:hypothetical protein